MTGMSDLAIEIVELYREMCLTPSEIADVLSIPFYEVENILVDEGLIDQNSMYNTLEENDFEDIPY